MDPDWDAFLFSVNKPSPWRADIDPETLEFRGWQRWNNRELETVSREVYDSWSIENNYGG